MNLNRDDLHYLDGILEPLSSMPVAFWRDACVDAISQSVRFCDADPVEVFTAWQAARLQPFLKRCTFEQ